VDREPPAPVVPYVPPPDSGNTTLPATNPSMQSRKMLQKKTELLVSTSIAASMCFNFNTIWVSEWISRRFPG
jgi:hypothetical protein